MVVKGLAAGGVGGLAASWVIKGKIGYIIFESSRHQCDR